GTGLNQGSKLVVAAAGEKKRTLWRELPAGFALPGPFVAGRLALPGVLAVGAPPFESYEAEVPRIERWAESLVGSKLDGLAMLVLCDDPEFVAERLDNFL